MKVFLGGTCNESLWREELIPQLKLNYFNPVVDDWTEEAQYIEEQEKNICDIMLYTITPQMTGSFTIAEVVQDSNRRPHKTVLCLLESYQGEAFDASRFKSLKAVARMVERNGSIVTYSLQEAAQVLNSFKVLSSLDLDKYYPVFLDTEFTELSQECKLISIGLTDIKNNTFYAECDGSVYTEDDCSDWVIDNILPTLLYNNDTPTELNRCKGSLQEIRAKLLGWFELISGGKQVLIVSDCLAYDWVLFSELMKQNGEFPSDKVFYVPVDIMGILVARGLDIDITREDLVKIDSDNKHNSLHDAVVIKEIWKKYL